MPLIMPSEELSNPKKISELAHKSNEPIFITQNGYSDLVVMSSEVYDELTGTSKIDQIIYEAEKETQEGAETIDLNTAFERLNKKCYG